MSMTPNGFDLDTTGRRIVVDPGTRTFRDDLPD